MVAEIIMPALGQTISELTIGRWHKKEGDRVEVGDILLEVITDKAVVTVESFASGVLRKILFHEGEVVAAGTAIALIGEPDEPLPEITQVAKTDIVKEGVVTPTPPMTRGTRIKATPLARRLARDKGIDLRTVSGSGPDGTITKADILQATKTQIRAPSPEVAPGGKAVTMSRMRRAIAQRMVKSKMEAPHFYMSIEIDMSAVARMRASLNEERGRRGAADVSYTAIVAKAAAVALRDHPVLNSWVEGDQVRTWDHINIGIAVALEEGLIVPVLREVDRKPLLEIAEEYEEVVSRARSGELKADEMTGGTFTISNAGMYGVDAFAAIINPPESAVLALGRIVKRPVVVDDMVVVRLVMTATLSADHRVADGVIVADFLSRLKQLLEKPYILTD